MNTIVDRLPADHAGQRFAFVVGTPLGDTHASFTMRDDALVFASDDVFDEGDVIVPWDRIVEAGTAAMAGFGGPGGPEAPAWVPGQLEWLVVGTAGGDGFMRRLPPDAARDALVAALRARLASRWLGEGMRLADAQRRLGIRSTEWNAIKLIGLLLSVFALLIVAIILLALVLTPFVLVPVCAVVGVRLARLGWSGWQQGQAAATMPVTAVADAASGLVHLQGRATTARPTPAAVTGRPSVWWNVAVFVLQRDEHRSDAWQQFAARHDGAIDVVELADATGTVPVWLDHARLLIASDAWESSTDALPAPGLALLGTLGFDWYGSQRLRVVEERLEVDATLTVFGTVDARRDLPPPGPPDVPERIRRSLATGSWRRALIGALPRIARAPMFITIGYLDMMVRLGMGKERPLPRPATEPPRLEPDAKLVWKGRAGAPFLVSNRETAAALKLLDQRSLLAAVAGVGLVGFAIHQAFEAIFH